MSQEPHSEPWPSADAVAPLFESYKLAHYRGGKIYRGKLDQYYRQYRDALQRVLKSIAGDHDLEKIDGEMFLTLNAYSKPKRPRYARHLLLFLATLVTTTAAGAAHHIPGEGFLPFGGVLFVIVQYVNILLSTVIDLLGFMFGLGPKGLADPISSLRAIARPLWEVTLFVMSGLPYSLTLMTILIAHEFGHYFAARRRGVRCSLPYFIPVPFFVGTLGAIARIRSPFVHRRSLLEVGLAGPLAGFILAVAAISYGTLNATVDTTPIDRTRSHIVFNESLTTYVGQKMILDAPDNATIYVDSIYFAGWLGLLVTMLNLLPLGQLDGGHVLFAFSERLHRKLQNPLLGLMIVAGLVGFAMTTADSLIRSNPKMFLWLNPIASYDAPFWPGWMLWAIVIRFVIRTSHPPLLDSSVSLGAWRTVLAIIGIIILIVTFLPNPISMIPALPDIPPGGFPV